jgi:hypothetical protein
MAAAGDDKETTYDYGNGISVHRYQFNSPSWGASGPVRPSLSSTA